MKKRLVRLLQDDVYQLIEITEEPFDEVVIKQGTLPEIDAYVSLEDKGLV